jgi:1-acyl-sn-glycerol-3-phosphate acyltransferase
MDKKRGQYMKVNGKKIRGIITLVQMFITVSVVIALMYIFRRYESNIRKKWYALQLKFLGIKLETHGTQDESCDMLISNHQSLLDIIIVDYLTSRNLAWVAKQEIADMFFFGHIAKAPRMICIDRENKNGLVKLLKEAKDRLSKGRAVAIFPEGTRSSGKEILPFKAGAKMVANKYGLRVQPVVLVKSRDILDSLTLETTPGVVKVIYLDPITADKKSNWYEELEVKMREILERELSNS